MGNNAGIAGHGTIFQEQLLVQEDTRDLERVIKVNLEVAEQYKYADLHAQREHRWHRLMSRLWMAMTRLGLRNSILIQLQIVLSWANIS